MGKKITRSRPWTKEEARMLKTLAREKTKTVFARKSKRISRPPILAAAARRACQGWPRCFTHSVAVIAFGFDRAL